MVTVFITDKQSLMPYCCVKIHACLMPGYSTQPNMLFFKI